MSSGKTDPDGQIPRVRIVKEGIVTVTDAFILTFFVNQSDERLAGLAKQVLRQYVDLVGLAAIPYWLDDDGDVEDVKTGGVHELQRQVFHAATDTDAAVVRLIGAIDDQTGYGFEYLADQLPDPRYPDLRNLITLWLPTELCIEQGWEAIFAFCCKVSALLPYSYGYGSPCLAYGERIKDALGPAKRYPGFDIAYGAACRVDIDEKALGAYWLNFFGESLSRSLGGTEELARSLAPPTSVAEIADGRIVIRLGPEPQIGDVNRQVDLPLYRQLAEVIEPKLHIPRSVYFADDSGMRDAEGMAAWHRRFLRPLKQRS